MRRFLLPCLAASAGLLLSGCQATFFGALNVGGAPAGVRSELGVVYDEAHALAMDFHCPAPGRNKAPLVVFFYGGSWERGQRSWYRFVGEALAADGVAVAIPDYRLYPAVQFPGFVEDAAHALAFAREQAGRCNADASRVFVAGHSAGAHLAVLLATDARYLQAVGMTPRDLAGAIGIAGPYDFLPFTDPNVARIFDPPEQYPASQPVNFVDGDEPPFLLLHGTDDKLVWLRNSERLKAKLDAAHVPATLKRYRGIGHIRILAAIEQPDSDSAPTRADIVNFVASPTRVTSAR